MPVRIPAAQPRRHLDGPWTAIMAATGVLAATALLSAAHLPRSLLLPTLSVAMIALAGVVAAAAWRFHHPRVPGRLSYWDLAGALTLFGIAAALLSDPAEVIPLLESRKAP